MPLTYIIQAVFAGLSLGVFCLSYCFPFLATFMASQPRSLKDNSHLVLRFILGRLLGYLLFGSIFGYLGEKFQSRTLTIITDISLILISIILILYLSGLIKQKKICAAQKFQNRNCLLMGFLMGINLCPPFLLSIPYVFSLHSVLESVLYFLVFFAVSCIYFIPMIWVGMLARIKEFQTIARLSGFICAGIFIIYGCFSMIKEAKP